MEVYFRVMKGLLKLIILFAAAYLGWKYYKKNFTEAGKLETKESNERDYTDKAIALENDFKSEGKIQCRITNMFNDAGRTACENQVDLEAQNIDWLQRAEIT